MLVRHACSLLLKKSWMRENASKQLHYLDPYYVNDKDAKAQMQLEDDLAQIQDWPEDDSCMENFLDDDDSDDDFPLTAV